MNNAEPLAIVIDYAELQRVMRDRKASLQISNATLDALSGLNDGHAGKLLSGAKNMGICSFGLILQGLALKLAVLHDDEQFRRLQPRLVKRDEKQVRARDFEMKSPIATINLSVAGAALGRKSAQQNTPEQRRASARKAAQARWARYRQAKVANGN